MPNEMEPSLYPFPSLYVLGTTSLSLQSSALMVRRLWQNAVDDDKALKGLPLPINSTSLYVFRASTNGTIGNGLNAEFWHAHWLLSDAPKDRFPNVRIIVEGLKNMGWDPQLKVLKLNFLLTVVAGRIIVGT
jgi:hypothetical protein